MTDSALVPYSSSRAAAGQFDQLLQTLGAFPGVKYAPGIVNTIGQFQQNGLGAGIGAGVGTYAGGQAAGAAMKALANVVPAVGLPGTLLKAGLYAGGTLIGSSLGSQLGKGTQSVLGQMVGGAQAAVGDAASAVANTQRESGKSAYTGTEAGIASDKALAQRVELLKQMGVNIPRQYLEQNYQILQKYKDADAGRQMQLNQQNAVLTGQLNQQLIGGQLAAGAQQQAGATTRDILTSNPYASSVLQTGGVRGI